MWQSDLLYAAQFAALRAFADRLSTQELAAPSTLPGWTVADLIAHLRGTAESIAALQEIPPGPELLAANESALTTAQYLRAYGAAADDIAQAARTWTDQANGDPRPALGDAQGRAMARLDALGGVDRLVRARRGPILLSAFLDTRVVEVVVHTADLGRSMPAHPAPRILGSARRRVVLVLREVLAERAANPPAALAAAAELDENTFLDLAAGRREPPTDLATALREVLPLL